MWIYQQSTGKLWKPSGAIYATGYAGGDGGKRPDGVNNPKLQAVKSVGPLPHGTYTLGDPVDHTHLGPFAIPLTPDADNAMYGRSGFYMHGDNFDVNHSASDGCIIMARKVREQCHESGDSKLMVIT